MRGATTVTEHPGSRLRRRRLQRPLRSKSWKLSERRQGDGHRLEPDPRAGWGAHCADGAAGPVHGKGLPGGPRGAHVDPRSGRAGRVRVFLVDDPGAGVEGVCTLADLVQRGELAGAVSGIAYAGDPAFQPSGVHHSGPWDLSFNTASSFVSNTSWQYYGGETTLSDFSQMAGITVASFTSCATGMAVAAAVIRGLGRRGTDRLGNFWVDLTRSLLYVLLPISALAAILLVATGVPQTLEHYLNVARPDRAIADDRHRPGRLAGGDQAACPATAAGSSTPTPRTPSKTPPGSRTSSRSC